LRNESSNNKNTKSDNSDQAVNSLGLLQHWDHGIISFYRPVRKPNITCVVALPCDGEIPRPRNLPNISTDCLRNQNGIRQSFTTPGNQKYLEWFIIVRTENNVQLNNNLSISLFHRAFRFIKFYSHQLMHFLIQICIGLLSYINSIQSKSRIHAVRITAILNTCCHITTMD
jgi:hypothetical protein